MNAKLLERLIAYREKYAVSLAKTLLYQKIKYQFDVLGKKKIGVQYLANILEATSIPSLLLIEARAARRYWRYFGDRIAGKAEWRGRTPHARDAANALLDIGYHYLTGRIVKTCYELSFPAELGFFHKAQSRNAHPFAYDFIEWLRPFVIERTFIKMIRKKKRKVVEIDQKLVGYFIHLIQQGFERRYYYKKLHYCVTLDYWIKLVLLEMMNSVNNYRPYSPIFPTLRHETRCKKSRLTKDG